MFCSNCGKEIADNASVCVGCGVSVKTMKAKNDTASAGWWWLGFLIPLAGLLIWICCNDSAPAKAKKAGIGALVGFILSIVLCVLIYVAIFVIAFLGITEYSGYSYYI